MAILIVLLVLISSGNPVVSSVGREYLYPCLFAFLGFRYFSIARSVKPAELLVFYFFFLITIIHYLEFGSVVIPSSLGFLIKLGVAYFLVKLVPDFIRIYPSVMVKLVLLSLIFYVPTILGVDVASFLSGYRLEVDGLDINHIGIHNFHVLEERGRNSGMFWEPGAFAGYLALALIFMVSVESACLGRDFVVLVVGLISTQSTTGYFALVLVVLIYLIQSSWRSRSNWKRYFLPVVIVGVLLGSYSVYEAVPFMKEKVDQQFETTSLQQDGFEINRFGNFIHDLKLIVDRPLVGWSPRQSVRGIDEDVAVAQGNGLSGFVLNFGLLGLVAFMAAAWLGFRRMVGNALSTSLILACLLVLLFGEQFLNYPLFLVLFFASNLARSVYIPKAVRKALG